MATVNEQLVLHLTAEEKRAIGRMAREAGLDVSEFVRRTLAEPTEDRAALHALMARVKTTAEESVALIDETLSFVHDSNCRIAAMEAQAKFP